MYILSQDKKQLINLDNYTLSVFGNSIVCDNDILTKPSELQNRAIGKYESCDRAKEVLYEICQYMKPIVAFQNIDVADNVKELLSNGILIQVEDEKPSVQYIPTVVYEMPEV